MPQVAVEARGELLSTGQTTGSVWAVVPPSQIQHYTSTSLSVGSGVPAKVDFVATAGTYSANVAFSCTLSSGASLGGGVEQFFVPIGSSARAIYISNLGQVVNDNNWVRTS